MARFVQNNLKALGVVMSGSWGDLWNLAMTLLDRETVEARILIWLGIAFLGAIFVEGLRSTFFARRALSVATESKPSSNRKSVRVSAPQARLWRVVEMARGEDGVPDFVAALPQATRNPKRRVTISRQRATRPGIHRRPGFVLAPEPAFTMEMPTEPAVREPVNGDLRLASPMRA